MPIARFQMPDGRVARFEVPDGTTPEQAQSLIAAAMPTSNANAAPLSRTDKVVQGITDPIHGGAQLLTKLLPDSVVQAGNSLNNWLADKTGLVAKLPEGGVDQQVRQREADYQAKRTASGETGLDGWRVTGNILSPANLAIPAGGTATTLGGKMLMGAMGGAANGALAPVDNGDFWNEKSKQVGTGAVFGGAAPAVAAGVSRVVSPNASKNANLQLLKNEGVKPTIGQTLGGWANTVEEKAQSLPIVGDAITAARNRAKDQFNQAAINRATAPINQKVEGVGSNAVKDAGDLISDAYTAAKNQLGGFRIDQQANSELSNLRLLAGSGLEGRERNVFNRYFKDYVSGNPGFTAEKFKEFDSKIGSDIAKFGGGDAYQQKLGDALKEIQRIVTDNAKRANPKAAEALSAADKAYANLVRVEGASVAAKGSEGVFTPGQLMTAVRGADKSVRDRATARGTALMQDLASAGNTVLGNKVPNSGTADRLMLGAGGLSTYFLNPLIPAGLLAGAGVYTGPVQSLLRGAVSSRHRLAEPVADAIGEASSRLVLPSAQVGLGLLR